VDNRVGSIEVGKDADLAIFNGHPFAPASRVDMTLVDGRVFFDRNTAPTLENTIERLQQRRTRPRVTSDAGGGK
jgi:cytosine/adenosine deaminase-related metal-dependent hydrolase